MSTTTPAQRFGAMDVPTMDSVINCDPPSTRSVSLQKPLSLGYDGDVRVTLKFSAHASLSGNDDLDPSARITFETQVLDAMVRAARVQLDKFARMLESGRGSGVREHEEERILEATAATPSTAPPTPPPLVSAGQAPKRQEEEHSGPMWLPSPCSLPSPQSPPFTAPPSPTSISTKPSLPALPALDAEKLTLINQIPEKYGSITLVGAGPGDPDLLTVAAINALQSADLIVSDRLVSPAIIERFIHNHTTPKECRPELRFARKVCGRAREAQDEIYIWCLEALRQGKNVVRLKGGDPFVFGRGGEELIFFRSRGVRNVRVIPGVSSSLSAPLAAGIPVTHRGTADQVVIVTGRKEQEGVVPDYPAYSPLRTVVFLMAMTCLPSLTKMLMGGSGSGDCVVDELGSRSYPPDLPVCVIEKATCPDQRVIRSTLSQIAEVVKRLGITQHATLVVGNVVNALGVEEADSRWGIGGFECMDIASHENVEAIRMKRPIEEDLSEDVHHRKTRRLADPIDTLTL
ncbi:uroporphyrin-III C-methyltransferase [Quaeritorhiza haematococci]|nr:uroporphyrin-III C-methyltransferase [Quaeritorhiza haematococci]